jgi:hypothetical protein
MGPDPSRSDWAALRGAEGNAVQREQDPGNTAPQFCQSVRLSSSPARRAPKQ